MAKWYEEGALAADRVPKVRDLLEEGEWQWEVPQGGQWLKTVQGAMSADLFPYAGVRLLVQATLDRVEGAYTPAEARRRAESYVPRPGEEGPVIRGQIIRMEKLPLRYTVSLAVKGVKIRAERMLFACESVGDPVDVGLRGGRAEYVLGEVATYLADAIIRTMERSLHTIRLFPCSTQVLSPVALHEDGWVIGAAREDE